MIDNQQKTTAIAIEQASSSEKQTSISNPNPPEKQISQVKDQLDKEELHILEHSKPFWFSQLLVNRPCTIFASCLSFMVILSIIVFAGGFFVFTEDSDRDFLVWSDEKIQRTDSIILAREDYEKETIGDNIQPERTVEQEYFQTIIVYEAKKGTTLLTPENIKKMQEIEKYMTTYTENNKKYTDFCLATSSEDSSCTSPLSIPLLITQSYEGGATQSQIDGFIQQSTSSESNFLQVSSLFDKDFSMSQTNVKVARSMYKFGYPLQGYKNSITKEDDQEEEFKLWLRGFYNYIEEDQDTDTLQITYLNQVSIFDYSNVQIGKDIIFSMFSAVFVTIYTCFHTKSAFVGLVGSSLVLMAFPSAFFFYRLVFQIRYISSLHTSVLFLLLGIGADDIFVFFDSFIQAGQIPLLKDDLLKRTSFSYRRASKAMLITSCTTIISFLATAISKLLPIMTYGIFAALNILASYLIVITAFPAFLIWREQRRINKEKNPKQTGRVSNGNSQEIEENMKDLENNNQNQNVIQQQQNNNVEQQQKQDKQEQELSKTQQFFSEKWTVWMFKARFPIMLFFFALYIFQIIAATQVNTPSEPPLQIKNHHFLIKGLNSVRDDFATGGDDGNSIQIDIAWGIQGVNQDNTDQYDPSDRGEIVYDEEFDLASNQSRMLQICQELKSDENKELVSQNQNSVDCFMEPFSEYAQNVFGQFPVPSNQFFAIFNQFLETEEGLNVKQSGNIGIIKGEIKYAYISFTGNQLAINGRSVLEPLYDQYEKLMDSLNKNSGKGFNKAFQSSGTWEWMVSEKNLLQGAIQGIIISLSLAFLILIISTMNIAVSLYSIICISGIVLGVFMVIWIVGWDFGFAQSMNSIIIIGLSVDYIIHLANTYCESEKNEKYQRVQDMLTVMGVSVIGGGFTTLGAGLFLFGGKLAFFEIMGTLVCSTIGFSLVWSLILFPAILHTVGPSGKLGDIKYLYNKYIKKNKTSQEINE